MSSDAAARAEETFGRAFSLHRQGRFDEAAALYQEALRLQPTHFHALHLLGVVALKTEQPERAVELIGRALGLNPASQAAHNNLGNALSALKRYEAAVESYDQAIALSPAGAEAYNNRGNALRALKRYEAAIASYSQAIALKPDYASAYTNLGGTLTESSQHEAAIDKLDRAIAMRPSADAYNSRGNALRHLSRLKEAIASYAEAIVLKPDYAIAHSNRGVALSESKRYLEAIAAFDRVIALQGDDADAYAYRGSVLFDLKQYPAAIASYDRAIVLKPDIKSSRGLRLLSRMQLCDWAKFASELAEIIERIELDEPAANPFVLLAASDSMAVHKKSAQTWTRELFPVNHSLGAIPKRPQSGKLHVGYFSGDFREHPVAVLTAELFELHDRSSFEITAFSWGPNPHDETRARMEKAFDRFIDVQGRSDEDIALLARELKVDIGVDLGGFTTDSRTKVFAMRVAPLQVNYLGYPGTMGAQYMDYLIGDGTVIPASSRQFFCEKMIYLPNSYLPNDSKRTISGRALTRAEFGLPSSGVVFCCFNNTYKISQIAFESWMRILSRVEGSVLWLSEPTPAAAQNLRREMISRNVDPNRLIFARRLPDPAEHLARLRLADLFVDTFPYNAHATAIDALWAGLPLITCTCNAFAGRVAASLLQAIRLPELIACDQAQYENVIVELALDAPRLANLKGRLADHRAHAPLFDTARFARHLEEGYAAIYERYQADLPPDHVHVRGVAADQPC
jgi:predicted O-linked N-acetylglucosamine transferase (SPINDLY family)